MSNRLVALLPILAWAVLLSPSAPGAAQKTDGARGSQERQEQAVDVLGDPLPPGATARLGTLRWRHGSLITASAIAAGGKLLATGGQDGTVYMWDFATGKKLREFRGMQSEVIALSFSADGRSLSAAGRTNGTLRTWETGSGKDLRHLPGFPNEDCCASFSEDGHLVAIGNARKDSSIRVRDATSGRDLLALKAHKGVIYALAFSGDRKLLASGGDDNVVRLWDVTTGEEVDAFAGHARRIRCVRFAADGKRLASASEDGTVRVWDVAGRKQIHQLAADTKGVFTLAFSPDGAALVAGGEDHTLRMWEMETGKLARQLRGHFDAILAVLFSTDGKYLVSAGIGGRIRIWNATNGKEQFRDGHQAAVHALAYSPDGTALFTGAFDNTLRRWELATGKERQCFAVQPQGSTCMALSPDGALLASATRDVPDGSKDTGIRLWQTATGKELRSLKGHGKGVFCLTFSPCGKVLAAGGNSEPTVILWDVPMGRQRRQLKLQEGGVRGLAFSPTGQVLACGGTDRTLRLFETASGKVRTQYSPLNLSEDWLYYSVGLALNREVFRVAFSRTNPELVESILFFPDGKSLATAGTNDGGGTRSRRRLVSIWDSAREKELRSLVGPQRRPVALPAALSPDGSLLALGSDDGTVQLRDPVSGDELWSFRGHQAGVYALSFSPDGKSLASASADSTILLWEVAGPLRSRRVAPENNLDKQLHALWATLADDDGPKAAKALWQMVETPRATVPFLKARLQPVVPVDAKQIARWIADLDHDRYLVRQQATDALQELDQALPALKETLAGNVSLEMRRRMEQLLEKLEQSPPSSYLRARRALEVLEQIGTKEAMEVLEALAHGAPTARLTQASQQAFQRLAKRSGR